MNSILPLFGADPIAKKVSPGSWDVQLSIKTSSSTNNLEGPILKISKSNSPENSGFNVPENLTLKDGLLD